jgi:translation initiation factor IF-3
VAISLELRTNRRIRIKEVRLISSAGEQVGIMQTADALKMAEDEGLDLVEVSPDARPPVCKIMDFGKFKYESEKREKEAKKKQHVIITKEIKFRPKIDPHDLGVKFRHIQEFLSEGIKVRVTVMFRGREMAHQDMGRNLLKKLSDDLAEMAVMEQNPKMEGANLSLLLGPKAGAKFPAKPEKPVEEKVRQNAEDEKP